MPQHSRPHGLATLPAYTTPPPTFSHTARFAMQCRRPAPPASRQHHPPSCIPPVSLRNARLLAHRPFRYAMLPAFSHTARFTTCPSCNATLPYYDAATCLLATSPPVSCQRRLPHTAAHLPTTPPTHLAISTPASYCLPTMPPAHLTTSPLASYRCRPPYDPAAHLMIPLPAPNNASCNTTNTAAHWHLLIPM